MYIIPDQIQQIAKNLWYIKNRLIDGGSYGSVYIGIYQNKAKLKEYVAVKEINNKIDIQSQKFNKVFQRQVKTLESLNHPNVVKIYGKYKHQNYSHQKFIVMELCQGGTLQTQIKELWVINKYKIKKQQIQNRCFGYFKQIIAGLLQLNRLNIIHRDLKPKNMVFKFKCQENKQKGILKIIDFGLARFANDDVNLLQTMTNQLGTPIYVAPQVNVPREERKAKYSSKCDVWSVGLIFYEMVKGMHLYKVSEWNKSNLIYLTDKQLQGINNPLFKQIIKRTIVKDQQKRISLIELDQLIKQECNKIQSFPIIKKVKIKIISEQNAICNQKSNKKEYQQRIGSPNTFNQQILFQIFQYFDFQLKRADLFLIVTSTLYPCQQAKIVEDYHVIIAQIITLCIVYSTRQELLQLQKDQIFTTPKDKIYLEKYPLYLRKKFNQSKEAYFNNIRKEQQEQLKKLLSRMNNIDIWLKNSQRRKVLKKYQEIIKDARQIINNECFKKGWDFKWKFYLFFQSEFYSGQKKWSKQFQKLNKAYIKLNDFDQTLSDKNFKDQSVFQNFSAQFQCKRQDKQSNKIIDKLQK